ncbi:hypothetical protein SO180_13225 [Bradyrhizobium sp. UFLA05-112]
MRASAIELQRHWAAGRHERARARHRPASREGATAIARPHFQTSQLRRLNRRVAHAIDRLPPLEGWAARKLSAEQTFTALNFSASPAFHNYGNAQTLHTTVAEPVRRQLLIGIGGDAAALDEDMLDVDFKLWVAGEDLPTKQLRGQLGLGRLSPGERERGYTARSEPRSGWVYECTP